MKFGRRHPVASLILLAAALRLVAAIFSEGYLMHDDHFLVVEAGGSWAVGEDYNNWFPESQAAAGLEVGPHPANFAYVGTQSLLIRAMHGIGISDPKQIVLILRILHGMYSLLVIYFVYLITLKISNSRSAWWAGLLMACYAFMPVLSVHQLVEMVCIPPLLWGIWHLMQPERKPATWLKAGIGIGLATGLRFQCGLIGVGWAIGWLWSTRGERKAWLEVMTVGAWSLLVFGLAQIQDLFIWGEPFVQLRAYFGYNTTHALNYPQGPPGQYLLTLLGLLVPPLSLAVLFGYFRSLRKWPAVGMAVLAFWLFHELYPNKQERFILPVVPLIVALGVAEWRSFVCGSAFWARRRMLYKILWGVTLVLNGLALTVLTVGRFKTSRVDAMYALYEQGDLNNFMAVHVDSGAQPPAFYSGSWERYWVAEKGTDPAKRLELVCRMREKRAFPNYLLFYGDAHLGEAVLAYKGVWPGLEYVGQIPPSRLDRLLHWLNPLNSVERVMIYRVDEAAACASVN